jgi:hypothetical protein
VSFISCMVAGDQSRPAGGAGKHDDPGKFCAGPTDESCWQ